jgi:hypothetical protein
MAIRLKQQASADEEESLTAEAQRSQSSRREED